MTRQTYVLLYCICTSLYPYMAVSMPPSVLPNIETVLSIYYIIIFNIVLGKKVFK